MRTRDLAIALLILTAGCSGTTSPDTTTPDASSGSAPDAPTATATVSATSTPTTPTTAGSASPAAVAGKYKSASCGERKYPRELTLTEDGRFSASDLVAPCPANVACVWSGIVERQGTFTTNGASITLSPDGGAKGQAGEPLVTDLAFSGGVPIEDPDHRRCVYTKM